MIADPDRNEVKYLFGGFTCCGIEVFPALNSAHSFNTMKADMSHRLPLASRRKVHVVTKSDSSLIELYLPT
jgi:hypothetical protein